MAYHCAVGKDRTGLLTALLLGSLEVPDEAIVADYARSAGATAVQVSWLWSLGRAGGQVTEADLELGVWSARAATMQSTLDWLRDEHGGAAAYLRAAGVGSTSWRHCASPCSRRPNDRPHRVRGRRRQPVGGGGRD